jgi:hypothetical protein
MNRQLGNSEYSGNGVPFVFYGAPYISAFLMIDFLQTMTMIKHLDARGIEPLFRPTEPLLRLGVALGTIERASDP